MGANGKVVGKTEVFPWRRAVSLRNVENRRVLNEPEAMDPPSSPATIMEIKFPESSIVDPPHKVDGDFHVAKESFFELAKSRIRYLNSDEYNKWFKSIVGEENDVRSAPVYTPFWMTFKENSDGSEGRSIENLEIVINKDEFIIDGESFEDLIPFILEHEIQESWLNAKRGFLDSDSSGVSHTKHLLAERREFYFAEKAGLGEKLFKWRMQKLPALEEEYRSAWNAAKKKLQTQSE